jgi:hypothetical protein
LGAWIGVGSILAMKKIAECGVNSRVFIKNYLPHHINPMMIFKIFYGKTLF